MYPTCLAIRMAANFMLTGGCPEMGDRRAIGRTVDINLHSVRDRQMETVILPLRRASTITIMVVGETHRRLDVGGTLNPFRP
jgi:hypothetical protein